MNQPINHTGTDEIVCPCPNCEEFNFVPIEERVYKCTSCHRQYYRAKTKDEAIALRAMKAEVLKSFYINPEAPCEPAN